MTSSSADVRLPNFSQSSSSFPASSFGKRFWHTVAHCTVGSEPLAYESKRRSHYENNQVRFSARCTLCGRLIHDRSLGANIALARAEGKRMVRATALVGRKQLRSQIGHQPVGDVAGGGVRSRGDRL